MSANSGMTDLEYFKYECQDEEAIRRFINAKDGFDELNKSIERLDRRVEVVSEQVYFARELIAAIRLAVEGSRTKGQIINAVEMAIENSYFEL